MSSDSGESHFSARNGPEHNTNTSCEVGQSSTRDAGQDEGARELHTISSSTDGLTFARKRSIRHLDDEESPSKVSLAPRIERPDSPQSVSIVDDTPSFQGTRLSSSGSSVPPSFGSLRLRRPKPLQPFERRFSSRLSPSPLASPRGQSPGFLSPHARQPSVSSDIVSRRLLDGAVNDAETPRPPWEVVQWTKLKKITLQVFSEAGKRNFGRPTCLNVTVSLVIGTSKGLILVFDYQQVLKAVIGPGTKAVECGAITALATSADHSTIAGGHATGHIFTWELTRPARPFLHILPVERATLDDRVSDGHISGAAVLHLGFLGTRRTALVSADDAGMAFSHLATRGLGAIARTVKTSRILGRYPLSTKSIQVPRKSSSVLAFAALPLGNVEQPTDIMGLTALLTPYLLIIVSTTPIAQTQHKAPRPKDVAPHSTLSGCLAWFPAVKLKSHSHNDAKSISKTKLVYAWSNVLTVLEIDAITAMPSEKEKPTELNFRPRSRWIAEEAIVAVQWLSRSVLGVLTISQRLIILEDHTLRITDSFDLLQKHIYHFDLFSRQLRTSIEHFDESDNSMHGVVADAFYMSFRVYKGRLFLLGFNDVSIGTLSNWADRLLAFMEEGDFIGAIELATSYYMGDSDMLTVGLPEEDKTRHSLVHEKLLEMITASMKYTFTRNDDRHAGAREQRCKDLAEVVFTALAGMKELEFLFEEVYDTFEEASAEKAFYETLEPYILDGEVTSVPPNVLKGLITFYASENHTSRLEEMICQLSTDTMDINQVTTLCQQYLLYDALIYVWTRAIGDYITPLVSILELIKLVDLNVSEHENIYLTSARKIFAYLAYTFTGRVYPGGMPMEDEQSFKAKKDMYQFLFLGKSLECRPSSSAVILTQPDGKIQPPFPHLQLILDFDASSFMSMLNEAFEDSFLNGDQVALDDTFTRGLQTTSDLIPTRQYILNILFKVMTPESYDAEEIIYFYMFVARNLAKYPQHIMLPGALLHKILVGLCHCPTGTIKEDCQLSLEYLLSIYHPPDIQNLVPLFEKAGFYRVLKSVYRGAQQYARLLEAYLEDDEDKFAVFDCVMDLLRLEKPLAKKHIDEIHMVIARRATEFANIDAARTAKTIKQYAPELLDTVLTALEHDAESQYRYLGALIEPSQTQDKDAVSIDETLPPHFMELYVQLMCTYRSSHVTDFVGQLKSADLQLEPLLPALEKSGAIDAAIILMARDGLMHGAMGRLVRHLGTLEKALIGLLAAADDTPDVANSEEAIHDLLEDIQKYIKVGICLCQGQTRSLEQASEFAIEKSKLAYDEIDESNLALDELLWLELVDTVVRLIREASIAVEDINNAITSVRLGGCDTIDTARIVFTLRSSVQNTFSALLASTTIPPTKQDTFIAPISTPMIRPPLRTMQSRVQSNPSFLRILRCFLTRATQKYSPSLSHLRSVLSEIFAAYTYEETILSLANRFLDKESFEQVQEITEGRKLGWRPRGQGCEGCKKRAWGPGAGGNIWNAWEKSEEERLRRRLAGAESDDIVEERRKGKRPSEAGIDTGDNNDNYGLDRLVLFACRHLWHKVCVEKANFPDAVSMEPVSVAHSRPLRCPLCDDSRNV